MTRAGVILGTAAYMSPEQAKGKPVDKRADVFAFGAVLYELLTGKRAFEGETITETIAKVLESEPKWELLPENTPWTVRTLLRRCLTKDVHDRLDGIGNVRTEIKLALEEPAAESPAGVTSAVQPVQQRWTMAGGLVVLGAVIAGLAVWLLIQPSSPEQPLNRFVITPTPPVVLASAGTNDLAISPDGRQLVYMGFGEEGVQLYLRSLDDFVDRPIPGTANPVGIVFFSPDGKSIAFFAGGKLKKTSLAGGSPITLCDALTGSLSGDWFEDTIVFSPTLASRQGLYRVSANGGEPEKLATPNPDEGEQAYALPDFLPDGKNLLFTIRLATGFQTALLSLETGERKVVLENARQARYLSTGHLVYEQSITGNLMAAPFDPAALEVTGDSVQVVQGVRQISFGFIDYAISDNGTLIYVPSTSTGGLDRTLVWVDREGQEEPLAAEPQGYEFPRISPDGSRLAVSFSESGAEDVWIYDLEREILTRLTFDPATDHNPLWTPDGQRIVFDSGRDGAVHNLYWKAADGTGQVERLTTSPNFTGVYSFSPDGKSLVHREAGTTSQWNLHVLSMEGEFSSQPLLDSEFAEQSAAISPSGRFIAYQSNESGQSEIYVRPFPDVDDGKWQISSDGGTGPVWAHRGQELFYRNGEAMMVVGIKTEPTFTAGSPVVLFTGRYTIAGSGGFVNYDISPDGQRFLMIKAADEEEGQQAQINVVLNWFEELKRLVPTN
jgi:serine/threonine-protein kinase